MKQALSNEMERDRQPVFRKFRDLSKVSVCRLEESVAGLGAAIVTLRESSCTANVHPLLDGLAECEAELIRRIVEEGRSLSSDYHPSLDVERVSHRDRRVGRYLMAGG